MKHIKVKDFVPLAIIAFIISIILNVYAYSIIKTSRISGISPFKHKIIWCQKKEQKISEEYNATSSQAALNWLINFHGDTVLAIPGATKIKQAEENTGAMNFTLSTEHQDILSQVSKNYK